jgi:glycosyltransferase involved in cell wall biosynthesis
MAKGGKYSLLRPLPDEVAPRFVDLDLVFSVRESSFVAAIPRVEMNHQPTAMPLTKSETMEVSVVMPCLNEAENLEICIGKARRALDEAELAGEVIIADNGSTDGSQEIAERMGARVVAVKTKGYGNALMGGIAVARGKYVVMGDADNSYDFGHIPRFVEQLRKGSDVVMGNRFRGGIEAGAMPFLHKHLGNPVLSGVGKILFKSPVGDFHCGLRGFSKAAFDRMDLRTTGMEFASEIVVKASLLGLSIAEVPTSLSPDGRSRPPHLRTWRDGWRHLRFLLLYSPRWLFLYPGMALMLIGAALGVWLLPGPRTVGGVTFDVHTLVYAAAFVLLGFQSIAFACFTKIFAVSEGLLPPDPALAKLFRYITLEVGLAVGGLMTVAGLAASIYAVTGWGTKHFGMLDYSQTMRLVIPASLFLMLGAQTIFASFFLSVLGMRRK